MPVARPEPSEVRVIAHVDLDCFYVQVEQRKRPELKGKPTGVVQYNPWKGGGLIAVGYEARKSGVSRNMRGDDAKVVCPDIELIQVPVAHGKADLTQYRDAGSEVVTVLARKGTCERASIDEVYLDITEASATLSCQRPFSEEVLKSHILGLSGVDEEQSKVVEAWLTTSASDPKDFMLANGAVIIANLRRDVLKETGFTCSAGIAHNKMLAKLASGMHKPAQQTVVPSSSVTALLAALPIKKMKQLGGKLGDSLKNDLQISFVGDLLQFSELKLQDLYGFNTGTWLWNVARGLSGDEVKARTLPKSHSCGKTFFGPKALKGLDDVKYWITELAMELQERLDMDLHQNNRMAHLLTLHAGTNHGYKAIEEQKFPSKSSVLRFGKERIASDAFRLFERGLNDYLAQNKVSPKKGGSGAWAVTSLFIGASNIWAIPSGMNPITHFFSSPSSPPACYLQGKDGPDNPLSPSNTSDLETPTSPCNSSDITSTVANSLNDDLHGKEGHMNLEPSIFWQPQAKQSKMCITETTSLCLPSDSPQKGDGWAQCSHEPPMHCADLTADVHEDDVTCTPTFGGFRHVHKQELALHLPTSSANPCEITSSTNDANLAQEQKSLEPEQLTIQCSPVEEEGLLTGVATCQETLKVPATGNHVLDVNRDSVAESRQQMSREVKLKDVWRRKRLSLSAMPSQPQNNYHCEYKEGNIDKEVFSELPNEIQEELCRTLGLKRSKKSTIGDFFKNPSSGTSRKADP